MSRKELVRSFVGGQMSRRVFMRRLVATGVSVGAAIAYAEILTAAPAAANYYPATDYYIQVTDYAFSPQVAVFDTRIDAYWASGSTAGYLHSATDTTGLQLFNASPASAYGEAHWLGQKVAGTYTYHCTETTHPVMTGTIRIPMSGSPASGGLNTTFSIGWSITGAPIAGGRVADVQRRAPGDAWKTWKKGVKSREANWTPSAKGTWLFRARLRDPNSGKTSGWSPKLSIPIS